MGKLHELLAVEKSHMAGVGKLIQETLTKFSKIEWFQAQVKGLKMLEETPANKVLEESAKEQKQLPTTVQETLEYLLGFWAQAEDVMFQKSLTNQVARGDLMFRGNVVAEGVPVDELLGLEKRLAQLRNLMTSMPTLPAAVKVTPAPELGRKGAWIGEPEYTVKTEKTLVPVVLYDATEKHPAQVKESSVDRVVGNYNVVKIYGTATSLQKAEVLTVVDELIDQAKQARMRANNVDVVSRNIGQAITSLILAPLQSR